MSHDRHSELFTHIEPRRFSDHKHEAESRIDIRAAAPTTLLQAQAQGVLLTTLDQAKRILAQTAPLPPAEIEVVQTAVADLAYQLLALLDMHPLLILGTEDIKEIQPWLTQQDHLRHEQQLKALSAGDETYKHSADWLAEAPYYGSTQVAVTFTFIPSSLGTYLKITNNGTGNVLDLSHVELW